MFVVYVAAELVSVGSCYSCLFVGTGKTIGKIRLIYNDPSIKTTGRRSVFPRVSGRLVATKTTMPLDEVKTKQPNNGITSSKKSIDKKDRMVYSVSRESRDIWPYPKGDRYGKYFG